MKDLYRCNFLKVLCSIVGFCFLWIPQLIAVSNDEIKPNYYDKNLFPVDGIIQHKIVFWEHIFYKFPSTTTIVHDANHPEKILDIIDHESLAASKGAALKSRVEREKLNELYLKRYITAIERFSKLGNKALDYGAIEQRVYNVYKRGNDRLSELYSGNLKIRVQTGLADEFIKAAERAQDYLPYIERVFRAKGVPTRISRLAFVESMFNESAVSKVGASGMWQFMPSTAKMYMNVNHVVDERNSPFIAAKGAASLLKDNYDALKSWPLAITAYNHGTGGISKAIRVVGSRNLGTIVDNYESDMFGFASRNFYAEFMAAANVYDQLLRTGKVRRRSSNLNLTSIRLRHGVTMHHLLTNTPLDVETIRKYNPGFKKHTFNEKKHVVLPTNIEIFVPTVILGKVQSGLNKELKQKKYANSGKKWSPQNNSSKGSSWITN